MREILFRGKASIDDSEKWVEGGLITWPDKSTSIETGYFYEPMFQVSHQSVGQFIGLKDRKGQRIFEGDLVKVCLGSETCTGIVEYDNRTACFIIRLSRDTLVTFVDLYVKKRKAGDKTWIEVVNNLYDDKVLMTK